MISPSSLAWRALQLACLPARQGFLRRLGDVRGTQAQLLERILHANRHTVFGQQHGFAAIRNWDEYRARVPLQTPADYQQHAQRIAAGTRNLLSPQVPCFFGLTSGLGGEFKLIAHPPAGLAAFSRAARIWLADMLIAWPAIRRGRAYLSISPPLAAQLPRTPAGIPLGMAAPSSHLAAWGDVLWAGVSITPPRFDGTPEWAQAIPAWRRASAGLLAGAADLSMLSLASPGFFDVLWQTLHEDADAILAQIHDGGPLPGMLWRPGNPARAAELSRLLADASTTPAALWPQLALITCWAHAAAAAPAATLGAHFPGVPLQPKGLWATEGPVSIPLAAHPYPVFAADCVCAEFIDDAGESWLAHQLAEDNSYRIVLTTAGGLYRYDLGDRVSVRGFAGNTPLLEFMGRAGVVSDIAGEKLDESFVAQALPAGEGICLLLASPALRRYLLVVDAARHDPASASQLASSTESALRRHWLYADRRTLGYLEAVAPLRVAAPASVVDRLFLQQGLRADGGKLLALAPFPAWEDAFIAAAEDSHRAGLSGKGC